MMTDSTMREFDYAIDLKLATVRQYSRLLPRS
jgi:hypothetical protein